MTGIILEREFFRGFNPEKRQAISSSTFRQGTNGAFFFFT